MPKEITPAILEKVHAIVAQQELSRPQKERAMAALTDLSSHLGREGKYIIVGSYAKKDADCLVMELRGCMLESSSLALIEKIAESPYRNLLTLQPSKGPYPTTLHLILAEMLTAHCGMPVEVIKQRIPSHGGLT